MRKFLIFPEDATRHEITPISYEEFMRIGLWSGSSDMAYEQWLNRNELVDPKDYKAESLLEARIWLTGGEKKFVFDPLGENNWVEYYATDSLTAQSSPMNSSDAVNLAIAYKGITREEFIAELEAYGNYSLSG